MCVWSAYAGRKQAAPIILEALKRTEGYWAGFYTGIATCENGRIYSDKCMGHTATFEKTFDLADYPGTIGLAHSRTASGGEENRAHPFVGTEGKVALISQGALGVFSDKIGNFAEIARELYAEGRRLRSGSSSDGMRRIPEFIMPDGNQVSLSDIVANYIEREYMRHGDMVKAMRSAAAYMQEESCTVCIFADQPGVLGFINMNQRIGYSFEEDGVYMGTTMEAFPGAFMEIPGNSVGYVTDTGIFHREEIGDFPVKSSVPDGVIPAVIDFLKANPDGVYLAHICDKAVRPLGFVQGELDYHAVTTYRAVEALISAGMVRWEEELIPGVKQVEGRIYRYFLN